MTKILTAWSKSADTRVVAASQDWGIPMAAVAARALAWDELCECDRCGLMCDECQRRYESIAYEDLPF